MRTLLAALAAFSALSLAQAPDAWEEPLAQQKWAEAESLLKQALAERDTLPALRGLVAVYRATGRFADTDPILERLVALDETAANIEDLARVKAALGHLDLAEKLYRRALGLHLASDTNPLGAILPRQRLAQVLAAEKKFPEAEQEAQIVIAMRASALGEKHPDLAADNAALARIYQTQKKWPEAIEAWETTAAIQASAFGYEDLRIAATLDSLADCEYELQQFDRTESALRRALAIRELNLGPANADVARTTDQLGTCFTRSSGSPMPSRSSAARWIFI